MKRLDDLDPMPFGIHKGIVMAEVPASYLHWLWVGRRMEKDHKTAVAIYIRENLETLEQEYEDEIW